MSERAHSSFLSVTELADVLVRREGLSFRQAHALVAAAVKQLKGEYSPSMMIHAVAELAPRHIGRPLSSAREELLRALDPRNFVNTRRIPGGPAPETVRLAISDMESDLTASKRWIGEKLSLLENYPRRLRAACDAFSDEITSSR